MSFNFAERATGTAGAPVATESTGASSAPSETTVTINADAVSSATESRPANESATAPDATRTDATGEEANASQTAQTAESTSATETTEGEETPPFNEHPAWKRRLESERKALEESAALKEEVARLKAQQEQTPPEAHSVPVEATSDGETPVTTAVVQQAEHAIEAERSNLLQLRETYITQLEAKVDSGELTLAEANAELAAADAGANTRLHGLGLELENLRLKNREYERFQSEAESRAKSLILPLLASAPYVDADEAADWVAGGHDPQEIVNFLNARVAPHVEKAVEKAVADANSAKDAEIAALKAEHERQLNGVTARDRAPVPIGPGSTSNTPPTGSDNTGVRRGFGFASRIAGDGRP